MKSLCIKTYLVIIFLITGFVGYSQLIPLGPVINGPNTANLNETKIYTADLASNHSWNVQGGTVISYTLGLNATCQVRWTSVGQGSVRIFTETGVFPVTSYNVQVTGNTPPPSPPGVPSQPWIVSNPSCGPGVLRRANPPNSDIRWYWQNSSTGSTTTLGYSQEYTANSSGTYYLRARRISDQVWSTTTSAGIGITVNLIPSTPSEPAITYQYGGEAPGVCSNGATLQKPNEPSGITFYWQGTNSSGTSTANSSDTYQVTGTGTYYLRAKRDNSDCWSTNSRTIPIFLDAPSTPASPIATEINCSTVRLSKPSSITSYWQGTNQYGTETINNNDNYDVTSSGRYYLRVYNHFSDCWSLASYVDVTISQPAMPASVVPNIQCELATLTKPSNTANISYYWQTSSNGQATGAVNSNSEYTMNADGTIFLRAFSNDCWSPTRAIPVNVIEAPADVDINTVYSCNDAEILIMGEAGVEYNLYESATGGSALPKMEGNNWLVDENKTYYLRSNFDPQLLICENTQQITISGLNTYSSVEAGSDLAAIANGTTVSLTGMNPTGGAWSGTGITNPSANLFDPSGLTSGNYVINYMYTNQFGCSATDSRTINLVDFPNITVKGTEYIAPGGQVKLSVPDEYLSYQWYRNDLELTGAVTNGYSVTRPGSYKVRVTLSANTVTTASVNISQAPEITDKNFIKTTTFRVEGGDVLENIFDFSPHEIDVTTSYFDGLGRPSQTVTTGASPLGLDIVLPFEFRYGRELKEFLPYVPCSSDGLYKENALDRYYYSQSDQFIFYQNQDAIASSLTPFAEKELEKSPLGKLLKQGAPGDDWQIKSGSAIVDDNHFVEYVYSSNSNSDMIQEWVYDGVELKLEAYYPEDVLVENTTIDENDHFIKEYIDLRGLTVLKRVQVEKWADEWADTYYVYDDLGNLRYVLPPEGVEEVKTLATSFPYAPNPDLLARWAFQYKYDGRKRMIEKKVPGAEPIFMIYDKRDRLVLTQDGNQRVGSKNEWTFTKYDALNRPILTGIIDKGASTVDQIRGEAEAISVFFENRGGTVHGYTNNSYPSVSNANNYLTATYYDDYTFPHAGSYTFVEELGNPAAFGRVKGQVTGSKVKNLDGSNTWLESVMYYDDRYRVVQTQTQTLLGGVDRVSNRYDFIGQLLETKTTHNTTRVSRTFDYDHAGRLFNTWHSIGDQVEWTDLANMTQNSGVLTKTSGGGSWNGGAASTQRIPAESNGSLTFQANGTNTHRMIGLSVSNTNANWNTIDYALYLRNNGTIHVRENGSNNRLSTAPPYQDGDEFKIERVGNQIKYWHNGTLLREVASTSQALLADVSVHTPGHALGKIYLSSTGSILLAHNEYNELGELIEKNLHSEDQRQTFEQSIDYRYNIRGWLKSINNAQLANTTDNNDTDQATDYWGMELGYNHALSGISATPTYNGNISAVKWSDNLGLGEATNVKQCAYVYTYDPMNRIKTADHRQYTSAWTANNHFQLSGLTYDLNGNIESLTRKDQQGVNMDILAYTYSGNQLLSVGDTGSDEGFKDGTNVGDDYLYDDNGNMTRDENKDIGTITYNHLNLPQRVEKDANNYILYTYDATGIKLRQEVYEAGALSKTTDYVGEFIYENNEIALIQHEEGRLVPTLPGLDPGSRSFEYQYHLKDHLGNTRVTFTTAPMELEYLATMETEVRED
ncbi:MAG: DUF6443 domain-containing protein [Bacteroidota bacterium]